MTTFYFNPSDPFAAKEFHLGGRIPFCCSFQTVIAIDDYLTSFRLLNFPDSELVQRLARQVVDRSRITRAERVVTLDALRLLLHYNHPGVLERLGLPKPR